MIAPEQQGHRFIELDALRGLAALAVVMYHYNAALGDGPHPLFAFCVHTLGSGHAAVVLFFVLSGFVLTVPYLASRRPTYVAFALKRLCRIYLPYFAAIAVAALLASKFHSNISTGNAATDQSWNELPSRNLLLGHLLMIGHFDAFQLDIPIWSLVVEMRISLCFPPVVWLAARVKAWWMLFAFFPLVWLLAFMATHTGHLLIFDTVFYGLLFVIGSKLCRRCPLVQEWLNARTGLQFFCLFATGFLLYQFGELVPFVRQGLSRSLAGYLGSSLTASGAVGILICSTSRRLRRFFHGRLVQWLGTRSYSIYLLHWIVIMAWIRIGRSSGGLHLSLLNCIAYLAVTALCSELFHRAIEVPALRLGRKIGRATVPNRMA